MPEQTQEIVSAQSLVTRESVKAARIGAIVPHTVDEAMAIAKVLFASRLFPDITSVEQAFVKILAGSEIGLPAFASLNAFHIVKGKVMMHYSTIAGRVRAAGYDYRLIEDTDAAQEIEFLGRDRKPIGRSRITFEEAKRRGTQNMDKFPRTMMFARAMSDGQRRFVPEAFNGNIVYSFEEQHEIESEWLDESAPATGAVDRLQAKIAEVTGDSGEALFDDEDFELSGDGE
jgi:hypothetical protein